MVIAGQYRFKVTVDNVAMSFAKISNFESAMEYEVLQEGGNNLSPRLLPLPRKQVKTLRMERGVRESTESVLDLQPGMMLENGIGISVLSPAGTSIACYTVKGVTVVKWEIGGLDALSSNVLLETFEVTYTGISREG